MRLAFLFGYIVIMWALLVAGSFVLIKVIAPLEFATDGFTASIFKGAVALSLVLIWLAILIIIKNSYIRRKIASGN